MPSHGSYCSRTVAKTVVILYSSFLKYSISIVIQRSLPHENRVFDEYFLPIVSFENFIQIPIFSVFQIGDLLFKFLMFLFCFTYLGIDSLSDDSWQISPSLWVSSLPLIGTEEF